MTSNQRNLQNFLVLNKYFNYLFGFKQNKDLLTFLKPIQEGLSYNNKFFFTESLQSLKISNELRQKLDIYDTNLQSYLILINSKREQPIQLKYFQYLAIIYTEIYLDQYFNYFDEFYDAYLNFVIDCDNKEKKVYPKPDKQNMRKLSYWSATGSGKTIIMHINILQIQKYRKMDFDNFLLITPNEGLSSQHIKDLNLSNIKNKVLNIKTTLERWFKDNTINVIEITKITNGPASQDGKTINVETLGDNNIIFVDEGHKGHSTDDQIWKNIRKDLVGKNGFTFEYSATFGEITFNDEIFDDYATSIIFDYRYQYFYEDGYGKDYNILNLKNPEDYGDEYFTFSLLTFYEQILYFQNKLDSIKLFNFEHPLMLFVGTLVSGSKRDSDIAFIVKFFAKFVNRSNDYIKIIEKIIEGKTDLLDINDQPISQFKLDYLKTLIHTKGWSIKQLYDDLLNLIFYTRQPNKIQFIELSRASGEIALKIGNEYFGLINIGDVSSFIKLIKEDKDDLFTIGIKSNFEESLFQKIDNKNSKINFLIGSKKFIEGWNSFRVSSMGFLNIGKSEGPQIIQLFGRGVRLKGYNNLLKRSFYLRNENLIPDELEIPDHLSILETLNIFGLNANYMAVFRESLQNNGVEEYEKFILKIKRTFPETALYIPRDIKKAFNFISDVEIMGFNQQIPKILIDLSSKVERLESKPEIGLKVENKFSENVIEKNVLDLIDLEKIYLELLRYKELKLYSNLYFEKSDIKKKLYSDKFYAMYCQEDLLRINKNDEINKIQRIEDYIIQLFKSLMDKTYRFKKFKWQQDNLNYEPISSDDEDLIPKEYVFIVNANANDLIENIRDFVKELDVFIREKAELSEVVYEKNTELTFKGEKILDFFALNIHLFQPLIYKNKKRDSHDLQFIKINPLNLVESERDFIKLIEEYINLGSNSNYDEIYLLRNPSRKGIGFFETKNFYPDFILWIIRNNQQIINFIDPKGLIFVDKNDEKLTLYKEIKLIEKELNAKTHMNILLNSFILSKTNFLDLKWGIPKEQLIKENILFLEDKLDCISQLFNV